MGKRLYTITVKNLDNNSRIEFRRQFHEIWNQIDIEYSQIIAREKEIKKQFEFSGVNNVKYIYSEPPKIDLKLVIEEGEYTQNEPKQFLIEEFTKVTNERSRTYNPSKINLISSSSSSKNQSTEEILILNNPNLIQIIGEYKHHIKIKVEYLDDLMVLLARGEVQAYDVIKKYKYRGLRDFIEQKYPSFKVFDFQWNSYGNERSNVYVTKGGDYVTRENFKRLIYERYLTKPNYVPQVNEFWKIVIQRINDNKISVNELLLNDNYSELRDYIENYGKKLPLVKVNIEKYRKALIDKVNAYYAKDKDKDKDKARAREKKSERLNSRIERNEELLKKLRDFSIPLIDIIDKYNELFLYLDVLEVDIYQFNEEKLYPKLNLIYKSFEVSAWHRNLDSKNIYFSGSISKVLLNKDGTFTYVLDEVVITADIIQLDKKTTIWGGIRHYAVDTKDIFEFLIKMVTRRGKELVEKEKKDKEKTDKKYEGYSFRDAVPYVKDNRLSARGSSRMTCQNLIFFISGFSSKDLDRKFEFKKEFIRPVAKEHLGTYSYYIYFTPYDGLDKKKYYIYTTDYLAFEMIVKKLGLNLGTNFLNKLSNVYVKGIKASSGDSHKLNRYYATLPTSVYRTNSGLRARKISQANLEADLKTLLSQWFTMDAGFSGANEEVALLNILMAMEPRAMYNFLYKNTDILYKIVDRVDGKEYDRLIRYLGEIIAMYDSVNLSRSIYFSSNSRSERDIHVDVTDWDGGSTIYFNNYSQKTTFYISHGKREALNLEGKSFHPLELVSFKTVINNKETQSLTVPAFYLYKKIKSQSFWDWFEIALDVVSVASIYGSARFIIKTAIKEVGKKLTKKQLAKQALAFANIAKEVSSFAIRDEDLNQWMLDNGYEDLLKTWRFLDTTGDLIYLGSSLKSLKNINLKKIREGAQRGIDNHVVDNYYNLKLYLYKVEDLAKKLKQEGKELPKKIAKHTEELVETLNEFFRQVSKSKSESYQMTLAGFNESMNFGQLETKLSNAINQFSVIKSEAINIARGNNPMRLSNRIEKLAAIKETLKIDKFTIQQIRYFEALEDLNIADKELYRRLIQHGKDAPKLTITPEKVIDNIKKGKIYNPEVKRWRTTDEFKIDRIQKTINNLKEKKYKNLLKIAYETKNYKTAHDRGLKQFIINATDKEFNKYLDMFRVDGKAGNAFMPDYKHFGEGLEGLRKKVIKIEDVKKRRIKNDEIKKVMEGYERHHQIMVSLMKDNPTFQEIMEWALSKKPPLDIGFNEFNQNIIILHKNQHGYHNLRTKKMHEMVDEIDGVLKKSTKELSEKIEELGKLIENGNEEQYKRAFGLLKKILKEENELITKKVIQVQNAKLDDL